MPSVYGPLLRLAARLPLPPGTLRESRAGMRGAADRWVAWAARSHGSGPVVWAHAASVGEQQCLAPVLGRMVRTRSDLRIVLTHTSPSVIRTSPPAAVCQRDYLPWDERSHVERALDVIGPRLLVCGRGDLWPELVRQAAARSIPIAVAGGTVRPGSARLRTMARRSLAAAHRSVSWVGAVSDADAVRWHRLGVPAARIVVTGDPRHDAVLERLPSLGPARAVRTWAGGARVVVAGSLEPEDDRVCADALACIDPRGTRAILVPHEPSDRRSEALRIALARRGLTAAMWHGVSDPVPPCAVVIVQAFGLLADVYLGADIVYVGGGGRAGRLHTVAEPVAVGRPVIVGPHWKGVPDADRLVASGGAIPLPNHSGRALATVIARLAADPADRRRRGLAARSVLTTGAARATAEALLGLVAGQAE